jgi:hypothetical protein
MNCKAPQPNFWYNPIFAWRDCRKPHTPSVITESQGYFTTGCLPPISSSWRQVPWNSRPVILFPNRTLAVIIRMSHPLSWEDGSVVYDCCWSSQRSHSQGRVPQNSWPHFTVSDSKLPQTERPGVRIYIPQVQDGPIIPPSTGLPFRRLLWLVGLTVVVFDPASTRVSYKILSPGRDMNLGPPEYKTRVAPLAGNVRSVHVNVDYKTMERCKMFTGLFLRRLGHYSFVLSVLVRMSFDKGMVRSDMSKPALIFFFTARVHTTISTVEILAANTHCKYFLKIAEVTYFFCTRNRL